MKYGLQLFGLGPQHYATVAAVAEENGFESVWMPEHLVLPEPLPNTYLYTEGGRASRSRSPAVWPVTLTASDAAASWASPGSSWVRRSGTPVSRPTMSATGSAASPTTPSPSPRA